MRGLILATGSTIFLACALSAACSDRTIEKSYVVVNVLGRDADIETLRPTLWLNGKPAAVVPGEFRDADLPDMRVSFEIPPEARGRIEIQLDGITGQRFIAATGRTLVDVSSAARRDVSVQLDRLESCISGWCAQSPIPSGDTIHGMWAFGPNDVWAVGDRGFFLKWNGDLWRASDNSPLPTMPSPAITDIWALGPDDVWLTTFGTGNTYHWDGASWQPRGGNVRRIWTADSTEVWGIGRGAESPTPKSAIRKWSLAKGWYDPPDSPSRGELFDVWGTDPSTVYFGGDEGVFQWEGTQFKLCLSRTMVNSVHTVWSPVGGGPVWAIGRGGAIQHSKRACEEWLPTSAGSFDPYPPAYLFDVKGTADDDVWIAGERGTILHWDGTKMSPVQSGVSVDLSGIQIRSQRDVWFFGAGGTILRWNGDRIENMLGGIQTLRGIWGAAPDDIWAVGDAGTLLHYNGRAWSRTPSPLTQALYGVWGSAPDDVWVAGSGVLLHWDGKVWSKDQALAADRPTIWGTGPEDI